MGLFDFLTGNDPSSEWPELGMQLLTVCLAKPSVNGVELGAPSTELSSFGRPSNKRPFKEERFLFDSLGITAEIENDRVSYFGLPVVRMDSDNIGPCEFKLRFLDGSEIKVNEHSSADALLANLPNVAEPDVDSGETVHFIHIDNYCLELESAPNGKMRRLNLYAREN